MPEGYRPVAAANGPIAAPRSVPAQPSSVQPPPLLPEVRRRLREAGMDPETDPLAPVVELLAKAADNCDRGLSPDAERELVERAGRAFDRAARDAIRRLTGAVIWRSAILATAVLLVGLGLGYWRGGADALAGCTVVPQPDGSRACVIVAWRDR